LHDLRHGHGGTLSVVDTIGAWVVRVRSSSLAARPSLRRPDINIHRCSRCKLILWHCSAPYAFFVNTDVGTITNRFGQDMELVDMTLPLAALNAVFCKSSPTTKHSAVRELICEGLSCDWLHHGCDTSGDCCKIPCRHHLACHDHRIFPAEILPAYSYGLTWC
jgi:hypothetical protein